MKTTLCLIAYAISTGNAVTVKVGKIDTMKYRFNIVSKQEVAETRLQRVEAFGLPDKKYLSYGTEVAFEKDGETRTHARPNPFLGLKGSNPFVAALALAYQNHQGISLSPDMIWLLICHGLSIHINQNPDMFRSTFTQSDAKGMISLRHDGLRKGTNDSQWIDIVSMFRDSLSARIDTKVMKVFDQEFSTTGVVEQTAFRLALVDAAKTYYDYYVMTLCGIPEIVIEGEKEDWESILKAIDNLDSFGLEWWTSKLRPIIGEFVRAFDNEIDTLFWCSILRPPGMSGQPLRVGGWSSKLFPYVLNTKAQYVRNPTMDEEYLVKVTRENHGILAKSGLPIGFFGDGLLRTPFVWEYHMRKYRMNFVSGFMAASYNERIGFLRPEIGYAITKASRRAPRKSRRPRQ